MKFLIFAFKFSLKIIYFILKFFPINNKKVVFLSRQSNMLSLDFRMIQEELLKKDKNIKIVTLSKKMKDGIEIKYYFYILKQMYHLATSKVCVIDSYVIPVSILKHKKSLKIIQIWHAMGAVKKFGYQSLDLKGGHSSSIAYSMSMHKNYDYVISGSDAMTPFFSEAFNTPKEKFLSYGLPRMDYLINDHDKIARSIYEKYKDLKKKEVILYVPTFRKGEDNKVTDLIECVDLDKYNLIIKQHPNKKINITDSKVLTCPDFTSLELLTIADYIITDYSAISIEASVLNKPIYFYLYDYNDYCSNNGVNIDLYQEMKSCCFEDAKSLYKSIESKKYDLKLVKKFCNKYVTNQNGDSTKRIVDLILK